MSQVNLSEYPLTEELALLIHDRSKSALRTGLCFEDEIEIRLKEEDEYSPKSERRKLECVLVELYGKEINAYSMSRKNIEERGMAHETERGRQNGNVCSGNYGGVSGGCRGNGKFI